MKRQHNPNKALKLSFWIKQQLISFKMLLETLEPLILSIHGKDKKAVSKMNVLPLRSKRVLFKKDVIRINHCFIS